MRRKTTKPTTYTAYQNGAAVESIKHVWGLDVAKRKAEALAGSYEVRRDSDGRIAAQRK
jgi:hypothetical protein